MLRPMTACSLVPIARMVMSNHHLLCNMMIIDDEADGLPSAENYLN